jgi:hypothetical protein
MAFAPALALAFGLLIGPATAGAAPPLAPAEPGLPAAGNPPEAELSDVPARTWVSLRPAAARLDREVPTLVESGGRFERERDGPEFRYRIERGPIELTARNDTVFVRAPVSYRLSARLSGHDPVECGSAAEPFKVSVGAMARLGWDEAWGLDARVSALPITHDRKCGPKLAGVDLTEIINEKILERISRPLAGAIRKALAEEVLLRPRVEAMWEALRDPVELGLGGKRWLDYGLLGMLAGPLTGSGDSLRVDLAVQMRPRLVSSAPAGSRDSLSEPRVRVYGDQTRIAFDCGISLDSLAFRIRAWCRAADDERPVGVQVGSVTVRGGGDRLAVTLETAGRLTGKVHLVGRIRYDDRTHVMSVSELDYSTETRSALRGQPAAVREALQLIRDRVEQALTLDMAGQVVAAASPIGRAVNRALSEHVSISGGMNQRQLLGVVVTDRAVVARLVATGRTWLDVR